MSERYVRNIQAVRNVYKLSFGQQVGGCTKMVGFGQVKLPQHFVGNFVGKLV